VLLAEGHSGKKNYDGGFDADLAIVDSDAIFLYQSIKRLNSECHIVVEIINENSITYLEDDDSPTENCKFSPQNAAGTLFTTSLLDSIICQVV
jgi:hypothetical protein